MRLSDITEVQCADVKLCVSLSLDCFNGEIVVLMMRDNMKKYLCIDTVKLLREVRKHDGSVLHSDRGCQYTSYAFRITVTTKRPATCTTKGLVIKKCSRCSSTTETNTPALNHSRTKKTVNPTCTTQGYTYSYCTRSGCSYQTAKTDYKAALGHSIVTKKNSNNLYYSYCLRSGCTYKINPVTITSQPRNGVYNIGDDARTSVSAIGKGLKYTWYVKDPGKSFVKSSITTSTYSFPMTKNTVGRQVYCYVSDNLGNRIRTNTATFTNAGLTVNDCSCDKFYFRANGSLDSSYHTHALF